MTKNSNSDQGSLEIQLKHAQEINVILEGILNTYSHEFRTPLTTINTYTHLLLKNADLGPLTSKQKKAIQAIQENAQRVGHLFMEGFDSARITQKATPEETNIVTILQEFYQTDTNEINDVDIPAVWVNSFWLRDALNMLTSIPPDMEILEQKISIEMAKDHQHVVIHIKMVAEKDVNILPWGLEMGYRSCKVGIEQQSGFLDWTQPADNKLELKLGLPTGNPT